MPKVESFTFSKGRCRLTSEQVICVDFSVGVRYEERGMCVASAMCGRVHPRRRIHNRLCRKAGFGFLGQGLDCGSNLIPNSDSDMNLSQTLGLPEGGLGTQLVALRLPEQILQRSDGQSLPVN